jgi:hypothetical protein
MTEQDYNGWTNKPTWLVRLWIDNDQGEQEYWLERGRAMADADYALADHLRETFEQAADDQCDGIISKASLFSDLMSWALAMVNWGEVAHSLIEDASEIPA